MKYLDVKIMLWNWKMKCLDNKMNDKIIYFHRQPVPF